MENIFESNGYKGRIVGTMKVFIYMYDSVGIREITCVSGMESFPSRKNG